MALTSSDSETVTANPGGGTQARDRTAQLPGRALTSPLNKMGGNTSGCRISLGNRTRVRSSNRVRMQDQEIAKVTGASEEHVRGKIAMSQDTVTQET